ncbi:hypothetical protein PLESTB_001313700 [Pleodorina starrii]|uniref:Uncharacterized protein n=1 Tax=Pleodorina starrii TaxID=330485 RepID=A0A9W6BUJ6_9CHLO|nr:hypothetical protein PLESTB_001313700 [Pleodorina starrii]GLC66749.1 hypothetical protein PLESTF_000470300 [Pleodorina starrii]
MASGYPPQAPDGRNPSVRGRASARPDDAELLAPPEVDPVQLSRNMFSQPVPRPPPAPLTNHHLKKVARMDAPATSGGGAGGGGAGGGATGASGGGSGGRSGGGGGGGATAARIRGSARGSARSARSVAASSVRGGRAAFSVVSDEEVIDVDGEPTTLADDDLDLPPSPGADGVDEYYDLYGADAYMGAAGPGGGGRGPAFRGPHRGGTLGMSGIAGLAGDEHGGGPDPLEELEADTPAVRLAEVTADLEMAMQSSSKDPWVAVQLAQLALGHAKVVWRTMPVTVREEPLLLAKAHFALARAYQGLGCDRQASEHGKEALAAIPKEVADTEAARALRTEVQVMRAEALLSSAGSPGLATGAACNQARKALALLVKAAGLQEPVAWTAEEVEDNELGGVQRSTIDSVTDAGIVALMAQSHGVLAEAKLKEAEAEDTARKSSLRSAEEAALRLDRRTERGDSFYSAEQLEKFRGQVQAFRDEADNHLAEVVRLAGEAERSYDGAMYCLNHVIDVEGSRLEESLGREGKLAHPTFQALWCRSLDFCAGIATAYALQRKDSSRLNILNEILSAFAQYGSGGWLPPARQLQALKDKGALLVDRRDYEDATACYEELTDVVTELYENDPVRRELQIAEVLKLRGDVALAGGDFRTAQHMFNQALEFYQRHLGVSAPVAQDLMHRIDEVKGYLADTRVLGRLASMPSMPPPASARSASAASASASAAAAAALRQTGGSSSTIPPNSGGGGSGGSISGGGSVAGGALSSRSAAASVVSSRSNVSRPPPHTAGSASGSHRVSPVHSAPVAPNAPLRANSFSGGDAAAAAAASSGGGGAGSVAGGPTLSTSSTPLSQRDAALSVPATGASTPAGSHRSAAPPAARASGAGGGGGNFRASGDGFNGADAAVAAAAPPPASVAGSQRRVSGSELGSGGHGWPAAASPAPSTRSHRSGDMATAAAVAAAGPSSVRSMRSGGLDDGAAYGGAASPAAASQRSGFVGGGFDGGAASPAAASHRSGYGGDSGYAPAASPAAASQRSGYGGGGGGFEGGAASPAAVSHRSLTAASGGGFDGGRASSTALSQRSGYGGGGASGGGFDGGAASPAAASHRSGFVGGGFDGGAASPAAASHRSGFVGGGFDGGAASPAAASQRSGYGGASVGGYDGGRASSTALSQRSGYGGGSAAAAGFNGGAASPAPPSQRSGYGGAASMAPQSMRSGYGGAGDDDGDGGSYGGGGAAAAAARASVSQSLRSADFAHLRGYGSTAGSQPRASGAIDEDFPDDFADGAADDDGHVSSVSPSVTSASRRLAAVSSDLGGRSARSQRSGASGGFEDAYGRPASQSSRSHRSLTAASGGGFDGGPASPAAASQRSGFGGGASVGGFDGGKASPAAPSQRSGYGGGGFDGGAASPAAASQRSGFGGGGFDGGAASPAAASQRNAYGGASGSGGYGGSQFGGGGAAAAAPPPPMSQRSGEFGMGLGKVSSRSSLSRFNNDPMELV